MKRVLLAVLLIVGIGAFASPARAGEFYVAASDTNGVMVVAAHTCAYEGDPNSLHAYVCQDLYVVRDGSYVQAYNRTSLRCFTNATNLIDCYAAYFNYSTAWHGTVSGYYLACGAAVGHSSCARSNHMVVGTPVGAVLYLPAESGQCIPDWFGTISNSGSPLIDVYNWYGLTLQLPFITGLYEICAPIFT